MVLQRFLVTDEAVVREPRKVAEWEGLIGFHDHNIRESFRSFLILPPRLESTHSRIRIPSDPQEPPPPPLHILEMSRVGIFGQISEINDHLFLSGAGVLQPDKLRQKKITCVINATTEEPNAYLPGIDYLKIRVEDNPNARLDHYFDMVADKIRSVKERGGKTLVHCVAGVSRSASLCIVYLVKYERMTLRQAYHYVKAARPIVRPNVGFWRQMVDFEKRLRGHSSVSMVNTIHCDLPIPDVYSNDLKKYLLTRLEAESSRQRDLDYGSKRRDFSLSSLVRPSSSTPRSTRGRSTAAPSSSSLFSTAAHPIHIYAPGKLFFSPAPSRRPRDSSSIFGNF
uniref:Dual specificity protein phosphatase 14 n=1 Tax=Steinernema glaseri TaxID=37863 RepID=A0A1I8AHL8_9BILA